MELTTELHWYYNGIGRISSYFYNQQMSAILLNLPIQAAFLQCIYQMSNVPSAKLHACVAYTKVGLYKPTDPINIVGTAALVTMHRTIV